MRVFLTATVAQAEAIFRRGYTNLRAEFGREGVYWADSPHGVAEGFHGEVVLCLDVPDELFAGWEAHDELTPGRLALIPAEVLNRIGKPQVYHLQFAASDTGRLAAKTMRDARKDVVQSRMKFGGASNFYVF